MAVIIRKKGTVKKIIAGGRADKSLQFILSCSVGDLDSVKEYLNNGVSVTDYDNAAVTNAAMEGHFEIVKYLVEESKQRVAIPFMNVVLSELGPKKVKGRAATIRYISELFCGICSKGSSVDDLVAACSQYDKKYLMDVETARWSLICLLRSAGIPKRRWLRIFRKFLIDPYYRNILVSCGETFKFEDLQGLKSTKLVPCRTRRI